MNPDAAQQIALEALAYVAADADLSGHFLAQAGADARDLRAAAADPAFLGFVLDFLLLDDATVLAFAGHSGRRPEDVAVARAHLPGGDLPNWT